MPPAFESEVFINHMWTYKSPDVEL